MPQGFGQGPRGGGRLSPFWRPPPNTFRAEVTGAGNGPGRAPGGYPGHPNICGLRCTDQCHGELFHSKSYCLRQGTSKRDSCDLFALHTPPLRGGGGGWEIGLEGPPPRSCNGSRAHRGKRGNLPPGKSDRAIFGTQTFGSQTPTPSSVIGLREAKRKQGGGRHRGASRPKTAPSGPISTARRAWLVLHGSPGLCTCPHCQQMITQQRPKGSRGSVGGHPDISIVEPTHASPKTATDGVR